MYINYIWPTLFVQIYEILNFMNIDPTCYSKKHELWIHILKFHIIVLLENDSILSWLEEVQIANKRLGLGGLDGLHLCKFSTKIAQVEGMCRPAGLRISRDILNPMYRWGVYLGKKSDISDISVIFTTLFFRSQVLL